LARDRKRLRWRHDAELLAVFVDDPDLANPDAFIHPRAIVSPRTAIECDKASYK
jgi:hypothetical protein